MERNIQQEIAQATLRGERDYAATLQGMDLMRTSDNVAVRSDALTTNEIQGRDFLISRIRDAV